MISSGMRGIIRVMFSPTAAQVFNVFEVPRAINAPTAARTPIAKSATLHTIKAGIATAKVNLASTCDLNRLLDSPHIFCFFAEKNVNNFTNNSKVADGNLLFSHTYRRLEPVFRRISAYYLGDGVENAEGF